MERQICKKRKRKAERVLQQNLKKKRCFEKSVLRNVRHFENKLTFVAAASLSV